MKNRIECSFGAGTGTVFLSLKSQIIFDYLYENDRQELHEIYGGRQYYTSRSGASGAGYLAPSSVSNDLIELPVYRDNITHLSEAWPAKVNGVTMMYPVEGKHEKSPIVIFKDDIIIFTHSIQEMIALISSNAKIEEVNEWKYSYYGEYDGMEMKPIKWTSDKKGRDELNNLPYKFHEFVSLFHPELVEEIRRRSLEDVSVAEELLQPAGLINENINIKLNPTTGEGVRFGLFGFVKEIIKKSELEARFTEGQFFEWPNGWVTTKNFAYRRYDNKVFAVYEADPSEFGERFSVLSSKMEYEQNFSIFEWFSRPVEEQIADMRNSLFIKVKNEHLNTVRWGIDQQISKTIEMLEQNPEVQLFIQDSVDSGNCVPGTENFMDQFSLKDGMTCKEILEHKRFGDMLQNGRFRAVVLNKFIVNVIGDESSEESKESE